MQVFDAGSRTLLRQLKAHKRAAHVAHFSPDRMHVLSAADDATVRSYIRVVHLAGTVLQWCCQWVLACDCIALLIPSLACQRVTKMIKPKSQLLFNPSISAGDDMK